MKEGLCWGQCCGVPCTPNWNKASSSGWLVCCQTWHLRKQQQVAQVLRQLPLSMQDLVEVLAPGFCGHLGVN